MQTQGSNNFPACEPGSSTAYDCDAALLLNLPPRVRATSHEEHSLLRDSPVGVMPLARNALHIRSAHSARRGCAEASHSMAVTPSCGLFKGTTAPSATSLSPCRGFS